MTSSKEIMDELDAKYDEYAHRMDDVFRGILKISRNYYYDALVYFQYAVSMMKVFGEDGEVVIPKEVLDTANKGLHYRIDQIQNDDGSVIIKLVEIESEEKE